MPDSLPLLVDIEYWRTGFSIKCNRYGLRGIASVTAREFITNQALNGRTSNGYLPLNASVNDAELNETDDNISVDVEHLREVTHLAHEVFGVTRFASGQNGHYASDLSCQKCGTTLKKSTMRMDIEYSSDYSDEEHQDKAYQEEYDLEDPGHAPYEIGLPNALEQVVPDDCDEPAWNPIFMPEENAVYGKGNFLLSRAPSRTRRWGVYGAPQTVLAANGPTLGAWTVGAELTTREGPFTLMANECLLRREERMMADFTISGKCRIDGFALTKSQLRTLGPCACRAGGRAECQSFAHPFDLHRRNHIHIAEPMSTTQTEVVRSYTIQVVGDGPPPDMPKAPDVPSDLQAHFCMYGWKVEGTKAELRKRYPTINPDSPIRLTTFFEARAEEAGIDSGLMVKLPTFEPGPDGSVGIVIKLARNYTLDYTSEEGELWLRLDAKRRDTVPAADLIQAYSEGLGLGPATWFAVHDP
ncbi:hypothetical protein PENSPDRAFT_669042 [Peniophora sp. CONT]|nr:hypothetical protein PENSPDRAFT_669042 [Peniophora sp. CONT]